MSAPLLDVLVKRPGPGLRCGLRRSGPRLPPPGRPRGRAARARRLRRRPWRASARPSTSSRPRRDSPDLVYTFDPLLVTDRGAIPLRPGKPNRAGRAGGPRGLDDGRRDPDGRADRGARDGRGRRHALAAAGPVLHRADAADERRRRAAARRARRRRRPDLRRAVLARSGRADPPHVGHLAGRRRPRRRLPAAAAGRAVGAAPRPRDPARSRCPTRSSRRSAATCWPSGPGVVIVAEGNPADGRGAGGRRLRGPHVPRDRDRHQRLRRADLHDPADPPWLSRARSASDRPRAAGRRPPGARPDPEHHRLGGGRRGVGRRRAARRSGLAVEVVSPDLASVRADPDWPGEEMARTSLPVVIGRAGRPGGRRIILSGHLDVVPPGDPATWTVDPWGGEIRDGALYGRGACDMKGGVAAILAAVRALGAAGDLDRLDGELVVALVPSEEDGGQGTLAAIRAGVTGDLAIIAEPSNLDIVVAHAGAITFRLTVPGRAAHASQRREGVSALDKLLVLGQGARGRRDAPQRRRDRPADDRARAAVPDDHRDRVGRGVGIDRARPGHRRRSLRRAARPVARPTPRRSCVPRSPRPARATTSCATIPATVEITGGRFGSARVAVGPSAAGRPGGRRRSASPAVARPCSASRTAPTCRCSSTSARRRASSSARAT